LGQPAARLTDLHTCPLVTGVVPHVGGPILVPGMPTVLTGKLPQARVTDTCICVGPPDIIVQGSPTVLVGGLMAARMGDMTAHGGVITKGEPTVLIGTGGGGGGGGGAGGTVGVSSGASSDTGSDVIGAAIGALAMGGYTPMPQARANKDAAAARTPFIERCQAADPNQDRA
jgi:uncharacterized Zn-binding protein involved in type VI secretion